MPTTEPLRTLLIASLWLGALLLIALIGLLLRRLSLRRRSADRLFAQPVESQDSAEGDAALSGNPLRRFLALAGYRGPMAPTAFLVATLLLGGLGLVIVFVMFQARVTENLLRDLAEAPAAVGDLFVPVVYLAPWILLLILVSLPLVVVRRSRRRRVQMVEQDLPLSLELMATLSESGLAFDAALTHLLDSIDRNRPLAREFITYQSNILAGRTRVEALRRFARRLEIPSVSILVSALTQADQMGTGIAQTVCRQAEDLRNRRRERANAFAMTLQVKRMFPLVICFMPGIFIWALGPFTTQFFQIADTFIRVRNF